MNFYNLEQIVKILESKLPMPYYEYCGVGVIEEEKTYIIYTYGKHIVKLIGDFFDDSNVSIKDLGNSPKFLGAA